MVAGCTARYIGTMSMDIETRRKKLRFRAYRRGFKEVDIIFGAVADANLEAFDDAQLDRFEALLAVSDWHVYGWLLGEVPVPPEHDNDVFALLRNYRPQSRWSA